MYGVGRALKVEKMRKHHDTKGTRGIMTESLAEYVMRVRGVVT